MQNIEMARKLPPSKPDGFASFLGEGAGIERSEMTGGVLLLPRKKRLPEQTFFAWCIIFYNFPHCLPVKNRRVVVARNTLPARSTVVGNSGWEGLQG